LDQDGIFLIDYLPNGQTINAEYYSFLLVQLKDIFKKNAAGGKITNGVMFLHENAPAYQVHAIQKQLAYTGFQNLDHPPYSPNLAPSDYHLFPVPKKLLKGPILRPTRRSLLPRRTVWTDKLMIFLSGLQTLEKRARRVLSFVGSVLNKSQVWSL
jgi:histone-lysine N-methyltransferase SETMAR